MNFGLNRWNEWCSDCMRRRNHYHIRIIETIKEITSFIRESKFKVTTQIQGEEIRVSGKSRDDLQAVIAAVRAKEFPVSLQFQNFRD